MTQNGKCNPQWPSTEQDKSYKAETPNGIARASGGNKKSDVEWRKADSAYCNRTGE